MTRTRCLGGAELLHECPSPHQHAPGESTSGPREQVLWDLIWSKLRYCDLGSKVDTELTEEQSNARYDGDAQCDVSGFGVRAAII